MIKIKKYLLLLLILVGAIFLQACENKKILNERKIENTKSVQNQFLKTNIKIDYFNTDLCGTSYFYVIDTGNKKELIKDGKNLGIYDYIGTIKYLNDIVNHKNKGNGLIYIAKKGNERYIYNDGKVMIIASENNKTDTKNINTTNDNNIALKYRGDNKKKYYYLDITGNVVKTTEKDNHLSNLKIFNNCKNKTKIKTSYFKRNGLYRKQVIDKDKIKILSKFCRGEKIPSYKCITGINVGKDKWIIIDSNVLEYILIKK